MCMKKRYLIILVSFAVMLICSCIAIGIMTAKLMDKKNKDTLYEIGETSIASVSKFYKDDLELIRHFYDADNTVFIKSYTYKVKNNDVEAIVSFYTEYLTADLEFVNESENLNSVSGSYVFEKIFEDNADSLVIEINYTETTLNIVLTYTYLEE